MLHKGIAAYSKEKPDQEKALDFAKRSISVFEPNWDCHLFLGRLYLDKGNYTECEKSLLRANELAPKIPFVSIFLGQLYFQQKAYLKAASRFQRVITLTPDDADAQKENYYLLARSLYEFAVREKDAEQLEAAKRAAKKAYYLGNREKWELDLCKALGISTANP